MSASHFFKKAKDDNVDKLKELTIHCVHPILRTDVNIQTLFLADKITLDELNSLTAMQASEVVSLIADRSIQERIASGDWKLVDLKTSNLFAQVELQKKLNRYLELYNKEVDWLTDIVGGEKIKLLSPTPTSKVEKENRFSDAVVKIFKDSQGFCNGLTTMYLARSALEDDKAESKTLEKDNLKRFYQDLTTIMRWDGYTVLTPEQERVFNSFIYEMLQFHINAATETVGFDRFDKRIIFSETEDFPLIKEESYVLTVTQDELKTLLPQIIQPDRLVRISSASHTIGSYKNKYYDSNNWAGDITFSNAEDFSKLIFAGLAFTDATKPQLINIIQFRKKHTPGVTYPSQVEIESKYADASLTDEVRPLFNALRLAALYGDNKSLEVYLAKPNININLQGTGGETALTIAVHYGYTDVVRILLAQDDCNVNLANKSGGTPLMFAMEHGHDLMARMLLSREAQVPLKWLNASPTRLDKLRELQMPVTYSTADIEKIINHFKKIIAPDETRLAAILADEKQSPEARYKAFQEELKNQTNVAKPDPTKVRWKQMIVPKLLSANEIIKMLEKNIVREPPGYSLEDKKILLEIFQDSLEKIRAYDADFFTTPLNGIFAEMKLSNLLTLVTDEKQSIETRYKNIFKELNKHAWLDSDNNVDRSEKDNSSPMKSAVDDGFATWYEMMREKSLTLREAMSKYPNLRAAMAKKSQEEESKKASLAVEVASPKSPTSFPLMSREDLISRFKKDVIQLRELAQDDEEVLTLIIEDIEEPCQNLYEQLSFGRDQQEQDEIKNHVAQLGSDSGVTKLFPAAEPLVKKIFKDLSDSISILFTLPAYEAVTQESKSPTSPGSAPEFKIEKEEKGTTPREVTPKPLRPG